ncbi:MAG: peroxiredoxin [Bacillota bacterium]
MSALGINQKAPDFSLLSTEQKELKLSNYKDKYVVLFFYPKDHSPDCTQEVCDFRDLYRDICCLDKVQIIGISTDDIVSHRFFSKRMRLSYPLLTDNGGEVARKYNVLECLPNRNEEIARTTFIIRPGGEIADIIRPIKVEGHAEEVFKKLSGLIFEEEG